MSLKILMVDGYDFNGWKSLNDFNCIDAFEHYSNTLTSLTNKKLEITTIHPGKKNDYLPLGTSLNDFDGIVWTGSSLNIYDLTPPIKNQIEFAKETLKFKSKIFGSCWGLQVNVVAAGGSVKKSPNGREMIFARDIQINEDGKKHYMYQGKNEKFDALCSHLDEIETTPENSLLLSGNPHSKIQALSFKKSEAEFWGTQYHPEFNFKILSKIITARKSLLVSEKIFKDDDHANKTIAVMDDCINDKSKEYFNIGSDILDKNIRNIELNNWINFIDN